MQHHYFFPNHRRQIAITLDASNIGIDACINYIQNWEFRLLRFFLQKLSEAERRTSTFKKEFLKIFASVKRRCYLLDPVTIFTDHKPIVDALNSDKQRLSDKQQRLLLFTL